MADWKGNIEVPGGTLYAESDGTGPAVVLIHAGVAHLRMWDEQVAALRDAYQVIRFDTRGFGKTRVDDVPFSNRADVAAVMDHFKIDKAHLAGLSRGGHIALDFAVEQPERVKSLTWVAGGVRGLDVPDDPRDVAAYEQIEPLLEAREWAKVVDLETQLWTDGPGQPPTRVDPAVREKMIEWNLENYRNGELRDQAIQPELQAATAIDRVTMPLLVMWGTFDVKSAAVSGEWLVANVPGTEHHVFEGVAHMVNLERPAEFNRILRDFLDRVERAA